MGSETTSEPASTIASRLGIGAKELVPLGSQPGVFEIPDGKTIQMGSLSVYIDQKFYQRVYVWDEGEVTKFRVEQEGRVPMMVAVTSNQQVKVQGPEGWQEVASANELGNLLAEQPEQIRSRSRYEEQALLAMHLRGFGIDSGGEPSIEDVSYHADRMDIFFEEPVDLRLSGHLKVLDVKRISFARDGMGFTLVGEFQLPLQVQYSLVDEVNTIQALTTELNAEGRIVCKGIVSVGGASQIKRMIVVKHPQAADVGVNTNSSVTLSWRKDRGGVGFTPDQGVVIVQNFHAIIPRRIGRDKEVLVNHLGVTTGFKETGAGMPIYIPNPYLHLLAQEVVEPLQALPYMIQEKLVPYLWAELDWTDREAWADLLEKMYESINLYNLVSSTTSILADPFQQIIEGLLSTGDAPEFLPEESKEEIVRLVRGGASADSAATQIEEIRSGDAVKQGEDPKWLTDKLMQLGGLYVCYGSKLSVAEVSGKAGYHDLLEPTWLTSPHGSWEIHLPAKSRFRIDDNALVVLSPLSVEPQQMNIITEDGISRIDDLVYNFSISCSDEDVYNLTINSADRVHNGLTKKSYTYSRDQKLTIV